MSHLFAGRRWALETTLTAEECVSRLKSKLRGMWETNWNPDRPLYGIVTSSFDAVAEILEARISGTPEAVS